jgi:ABC-type transport system substrate-binding protein
MRRRGWGVVVASIVVGLVATACGGSTKSSEGSGPSAQASTTQPEQPARGATLVAALTSDPGSLNPAVTWLEGPGERTAC